MLIAITSVKPLLPPCPIGCHGVGMCPSGGLCGSVSHRGRVGENQAFQQVRREKGRVENKAGEKDGAMAPSKVTASGNARRAFRKDSG